MKINILGFEQEKIMNLPIRINATDLLVLRTMVDMIDSKRLETKEIDGEVYTWINYNLILEDLPMVATSVETIKKIVSKFCLTGLLDRKVKKHINGGAFTYFKVTNTLVDMMYKEDIIKNETVEDNTDKKTDKPKKTSKKQQEEIFVPNECCVKEVTVSIVGECMTEKMTVSTAKAILDTYDKIDFSRLIKYLEYKKSSSGILNNSYVVKSLDVYIEDDCIG
ncbi:MAG: hypothetical protein RSE41_07975 [Clostridia bacterium]